MGKMIGILILELLWAGIAYAATSRGKWQEIFVCILALVGAITLAAVGTSLAFE